MSAQIPDTLLVSEILKPTGFDCPEDLVSVTFNEATSGGGDEKPEQEKSVTITENGTSSVTPDEGKTLKKVNITVNVPGGGVSTLYAFTFGTNVYYSTTLDLKAGDELLAFKVTGYDPTSSVTVESYDSSTHVVTNQYGEEYGYDSTKNISLV